MTQNRLTYVFNDTEGETADTGLYLKTAYDPTGFPGNVSDLNTALVACTDTAIGHYSIQLHASDAGAASSGAYSSVQDKAVLQLQCADGTFVMMSLPGPDEGIFKANDNEEVDPLDAAIIALITQLIAFGSNKFGSAIVGLYRGWRSRNGGRH